MTTLDEPQIDKIRAFNRFYTRMLGLLNEGLFKSDFSLTEARIIYELGEVDALVAKQLGQLLALDAGYLSRVLNKMIKNNIILRIENPDDRRQQLLSLTNLGETARLDLRERSIGQVAELYKDVSASNVANMVKAMADVQQILEPSKNQASTYILRDPEVGDLAYIAHRQTVLYEQEYAFGTAYEAIVCEVVAEYISNLNAANEKCWIAESDGEIVGSIFCVDGGDNVAKLRLLYVDPAARGMGLGGKLIDEVVKFARKKGYRKIVFWTVDCLDAALHLYAKAGFEHVSSQAQNDFGMHLNDGAGIMRQDWEMVL
ncbi:MAG: helix-turn-helix domain-containing GNAT family N-acetyltransferase [Hyphomicrobiales bacterium]